MRMVWNGEMKRVAFVFGVIFLAGVLALNLCVGIYSGDVRLEYNEFLACVFGNISAAYPEVSEEELVRVLCDNRNMDYGMDILGRYGIFGKYGGDTFAVRESRLLFLRVSGNVFLVLLFLCGGAVLFLYLKKRQNRIYTLTDYMETLNRRNYQLDIGDNADDELSGLRNEIYKLVVLLREQADIAAGQKAALADSVADISHQLKTPLTSVMVLMDDLAENPDMDRNLRQRFMSEITRQLTGMSWLISTLLKLSRLDAGVVELQKAPFNMRAFVEEVLQRLEMAAEWGQVSFSLDIPESAVLDADKKWTAEALLNIVKNAVEHSPAGSLVEISGEENDVYAVLAVRDYGAGLAREELRKLFMRFYNGRGAREDSTGIGLALAKEIVEKQGGYISVDSLEGKGTLFQIKFLKQ